MHLITRSARRATRIVKGGPHVLTGYKREAHRKYRHRVHELETMLASQRIDADDSDLEPTRGDMVTGWEVA